MLQSLASVASNLTVIVLLLLFLAMDASNFPQKLSSNRVGRPAAVTALQSFAHGTRQYLIVSTVFGFIVAVLDSAFLAFTPVPDPLLWGLLAFITNYIPNVGFIIGLVPPAALGLLISGPGLMLLIIVVYIVLNFIIQSVIQPKFVGDAVGLSVSLTFLSLIFWVFVLGPAGAFLAVPLSLLAKALLVDVDSDSSWLRPLLSGEPARRSRNRSRAEASPTDGPPDGTARSPTLLNEPPTSELADARAHDDDPDQQHDRGGHDVAVLVEPVASVDEARFHPVGRHEGRHDRNADGRCRDGAVDEHQDGGLLDVRASRCEGRGLLPR